MLFLYRLILLLIREMMALGCSQGNWMCLGRVVGCIDFECLDLGFENSSLVIPWPGWISSVRPAKKLEKGEP